jgi:uncharacterized protein with HEPN domain
MKQSKLSDRERLLHIIEAIEMIKSFSYGHNYESFLKDQKTLYACLFQYSIIGEATACMSQELLEKYDYPWHKVKSFTNFIIHEYHAIDERVIWNTTKKILPELEKIIRIILENEFRLNSFNV